MQLIQRLQSAVTEHKTIRESIILIVALDLLHNDFEMTTTPLLHSGDKYLEEIQQIVTSIKAANLAKCTVGVTVDLALMAKTRQPIRATVKFKLEEEYFNYEKKGHYTKDYRSFISNKRKPVEESTIETKRS